MPATVAELDGESFEYALMALDEVASLDHEFVRIDEMSCHVEGNDLHMILVRFRSGGSTS